MLVEKHSKIASYVLPASIAVGFAYTANYGTNPVEDFKSYALGESWQPCFFHHPLSHIMNVNL